MLLDLFHFSRYLVLGAGGLLLPGWLLGRALGTPGGVAGALLGSAALLVNLLLFLDAVGVRLDLLHLSFALLLLCIGLAVIARLRPTPPSSETPTQPTTAGLSPWWLIPPALALLAIGVRVILEPLSGWDTAFRWDFLAREIIRTGSLGFYPPFTADDFLHFGWCDGIAPLVSGLYAWSYLSLGRVEAWATTPIVIGQALLIFHLVNRLAAARFGAAAGAAAGALLATSPVFLWAVAMGQETGLTALAVIAMFWFIEQGRTSAQPGWLVWAGLAAGTGALAREYGLGFPALGLFALVLGRRPLRPILVFLATAAVVALPWYLRNWIKTGHPLYSFELGTLFPVNPVHVEYMHVVDKTQSLAADPGGTVSLFLTVLLLAGGPLVLGFAAGCVHWRRDAAWLAALIALFGLWVWLAGLTSGGAIYSIRALAPAIALGAVLGGGWLARAIGGKRGWLVALAIGAMAIHAGVTSLYLPIEPRVQWWRETPLAWHQFGRLRQAWSDHSRWQAIVDAAGNRKILVSDPLLHALFVNRGGRAMPFFSPEVKFLFGSATEFEAATARLRAAGYRFILITRGNPVLDAQLAPHAFFTALAATAPVASGRLYVLYDLYPAEQRRPDPRAP